MEEWRVTMERETEEFKKNLKETNKVITQWASLPSVICRQIHTYMSTWNGVAFFVSIS